MQTRSPRTENHLSEPPVGEPAARDRMRKRRWPRRLGFAAVTLLAVVAVSTTVNLVLEWRERSVTSPYGQRVPVSGGHLNVWRNGRTGPTIVLLSGLGTVAPALDFAPLVRELEGYDVIVVERFGYGYSDMSGPPQTVANVTSELHEALVQVGVRKPFVLVAHSIAGFYALSYVDRYPGEVSAVIGIDPTIPAAKAGAAEPAGGGIEWGRVLAVTGVVRAAIAIEPGLAEPPGGAFTPEELVQIRRMTIWNYGNAATADETRRMSSNATALRGVTYPDELPVLEMLAKESVDTIPRWIEQHRDQLRNVQRHEVVVLDGRHYLHWTKSREMARMITDFIGR